MPPRALAAPLAPLGYFVHQPQGTDPQIRIVRLATDRTICFAYPIFPVGKVLESRRSDSASHHCRIEFLLSATGCYPSSDRAAWVLCGLQNMSNWELGLP